MIKLVAFDWNGTVLADVNGTLRANNAVFRHFKLPELSLKEYRKHFQVPIRDYWITLGFDTSFFDKYAAEQEVVFLNNFEPEENVFRTRSGMRDLLKFLKSQNLENVIFSNNIIPRIEKQIERLGLESDFSKVLARPANNRDHQVKKFKGGYLNDFVKVRNFKPQEVLIVGDTAEEIEIGKEFGFITVAISGGHQSIDRLKVNRPDYLIHNLTELKNIIQQINGRTNPRN